MAAVVRSVASIAGDTVDMVELRVHAALNPESLDGITDWSHCWVLFLAGNMHTTVEIKLFSIVSVDNRKLSLKKLEKFSFPQSAIIVDIKPFHPLDNVTL